MSAPKEAITLRIPSKYASSSSPSPSFSPPPLDWLHRTWTVTHSTLAMWRTARNVRITYSPLPADPAGRARIDDLVQYEKKTSGKAAVKTVQGVDTCSSPGEAGTASWDWRGKGLLAFVTSHWEVVGWGERDAAGGEGEGGGKERWAVTWFAPTLFTKEGVDLYSDRKGGMSPALAADILAALKGLGAEPLVRMVEADMKEVEVRLPWLEG
ncbi:hypothetical protein KVR01_007454 [Diaporthe batatas]|uniref:uncharacterized protein n=1 Tax=Diaporthe batatas TaxID=748121 RepID=UPI001D037A00|nr:uncharacterized protein KVR01_007454 [Diaporthe batatas]KAG8162976.1 hypothetical protein KVR01_007454 [Diaporthe batatas]